jgi:hypothetical protein
MDWNVIDIAKKSVKKYGKNEKKEYEDEIIS